MMNVVATGLFNIMKANGALMTAIGGVVGNGWKLYHVVAPQDASLPYITFGMLTDVPLGVFKNLTAIEDSTWWFNCFSTTGSKDVGDILKALTDVLDNASLTVAPYTSMVCAREFTGNILFDIDLNTFQIPTRYRIRIT